MTSGDIEFFARLIVAAYFVGTFLVIFFYLRMR